MQLTTGVIILFIGIGLIALSFILLIIFTVIKAKEQQKLEASLKRDYMNE